MEMTEIIRNEMGDKTIDDYLRSGFICNIRGTLPREDFEKHWETRGDHRTNIEIHMEPGDDGAHFSGSEQYRRDRLNDHINAHTELYLQQSPREFMDTIDRVLEETCDMDQIRSAIERLYASYEESRPYRTRERRLSLRIRSGEEVDSTEYEEADQSALEMEIKTYDLRKELNELIFPAYVRLREMGYSWRDLCA